MDPLDKAPSCRSCGEVLKDLVVDLGMSPLCESYVPADALDGPETFFPLRVLVCRSCWLLQLEQYVPEGDIFTEYAYFSSYSSSWLDHARRYVADACTRFDLGPDDLVVELASNDGYLLRWFVEAGIPVLGIEPAANVAAAAEEHDVPTLVRFFGRDLAWELVANHQRADLLVANNVLAQVPDLDDFVCGMAIVLAADGVATIEFPHTMRLLAENQFDTIYHEHFSYFSLHTAVRIFADRGLEVFDVDELPTHGGSLRLYVHHASDTTHPVSPAVAELLQREDEFGLTTMDCYERFAEMVADTKRDLLDLLIRLKREGASVAGYGAPGKGNTLLNYCGIRTDFLDFTVDRNPYKQGRFLPGTHIPILAPEAIDAAQPDYLLVLPWNVKDEIIAQMGHVREWGCQFIVPIPRPHVVP